MTIKTITLTILAAFMLALCFYVGMTKELCRRDYSAADKAAMRLQCDQPIWKNL